MNILGQLEDLPAIFGQNKAEFVKKENQAMVAQLHPLGCGVACVASRCGLSYKAALSLFARQEHAWTRGFYCSEIVEALSNAGFKYAFAKYDPSLHEKVIEIPGAIVFVGPCSDYPSGHFLLRCQTGHRIGHRIGHRMGWMNPWANFPMMNDVEAKLQKTLPAQVTYVIYEQGAMKRLLSCRR
jgi:hypothetical protein